MSMRVLISGSSGLIGSALTRRLGQLGHEVRSLVRRPARAGEVTWDPARGSLDPLAFEGCTAVVNLSGAGIGDKRWSEEYKQLLVSSRIEPTQLLATTMAELADKPQVFVSGSAIGCYGDRGDEELDERSTYGDDFLSDLCRRWEAATAPAEDAGIRTVQVRTGIVQSKAGGALKNQLLLFKLGLGGRFGSGRQWQSWIAIDDEVDAIVHLLDAAVRGPVNLVAPSPVTNAEFAKTLGRVLHRPAVVPTPLVGPKLLFGSELVEALLLSSQRVVPTALLDSGFEFSYPQLEPALRHVLGR